MTRARARLATTVLLGLLAGAPSATQAVAGALAGTGTGGAAVTGTVVRVEAGHDHGGVGHADTLLQVGDDLVLLAEGALEDVRAGGRVTVVLGSVPEGGEPGRPVEQVLDQPPPADPDEVAAGAGTPALHRVYVALVAPSGTVPDSTTQATAQAAVEAAGTFWREETRGAVDLQVVRTADWARSPATCSDYTGLWRTAATSAGFPGGAGDHLVAVLPSSATGKGCALGLATVGGTVAGGGRSHSSGTGVSVIAHELGHNLSLGHAGSLYCPGSDTQYPSVAGCSREEYGDLFDVMGYGGQFAPQGGLGARWRERLGLLPSLQTVSGDGADVTVDLVPIASASDSATHVVKVEDPAGDAYWIEYRTAAGRDALAGARAGGPEYGVRISKRDAAVDRNTVVLDPTPTRHSDRAQALPVGVPWLTASRRTRVTLLAQDARSARLRIETTATPYPPTGAPPTPPSPPTPTSDATVLALTGAPSTAYLGRYAVTGLVYNADSMGVKGVPVTLQAQGADGAWVPVRTVKTGAGGAATFPLQAGDRKVPVRVVASPTATSSISGTSAVVAMPVYTPVALTKVVVPRTAASSTVAVVVHGRSVRPTAATLRVEHRQLDAAGRPVTPDWTVGSGAPTVVDGKGSFTLPLALRGGTRHEVRLVRLATAQHLQSVSAVKAVAVPG